MAVNPTTDSGAVKGTPVDTSPTTSRINIVAAVGEAIGIALVVYGLAVHQPDTTTKGIEVISGAAVGLGSTATAIWGHVQAMFSEIDAATGATGTVTTVTQRGPVTQRVQEPLANATVAAPVPTPVATPPATPPAS